MRRKVCSLDSRRQENLEKRRLLGAALNHVKYSIESLQRFKDVVGVSSAIYNLNLTRLILQEKWEN